MKTMDIVSFDQYAIFQTGGKQYQAIPGKTVAIEKINVAPGETYSFDTVLFRKQSDSAFEVGQPYISGAAIKVRVVKHDKAAKIIVYKHKRRKSYHLKKGHRQPQTIVRIESI